MGNLTSQVFANFYMHDFDSFVKDELKIKYYGRYVDDFIICSNDKKILKKIILVIKHKLSGDLNLELHPKKIYLQHYKKGVQFLGANLKPGRVYIGNKTKGNFYAKNHKFTLIKNTTS
ncbi:RNA-directed DNA polymerase [Siansivirga zeaxanthinifaciens]|uniref:RNA-directed DNA polymerase n=1 Tax=Siansivirga zeaxanthinifaciens TaxID=762954 RepID=UPI0009FFF930|nr:RNA-directed DNA polymerase [Siansivirga zeaxanthinifaciens]